MTGRPAGENQRLLRTVSATVFLKSLKRRLFSSRSSMMRSRKSESRSGPDARIASTTEATEFSSP
jgi:hypothetical protein